MFSRSSFVGQRILQISSRNPTFQQQVLQLNTAQGSWRYGYEFVDKCNLDDYVRSPSSYNDKMFCGLHSIGTANGRISTEILRALRDMIKEFYCVTSPGRLKPQNMWIGVHDYFLTGRLDSNDLTLDCKWNAPEQLLGGELSFDTDLFRLGCIIFYTITGGRHPFGEDIDQCHKNIIANNPVNLSQLEDIPEAFHLISRLLNADPMLRPKYWEVVNHPLFWCPLKRLEFLMISSRVVHSKHYMVPPIHFSFVRALKRKAPSIINPMWYEKAKGMDEEINCQLRLTPSINKYPKENSRISKYFRPVLDLQFCGCGGTRPSGLLKASTQDVLGPRRSSTSGFYQRLLTNVYEASVENYGSRWNDMFVPI